MASIEGFQRRATTIVPREFKGSGSRFRNGDTVFARITPCLENGKTAFISDLSAHQVGWGSTEFIVLSAKSGLTDNLFVYYLSVSPEVRKHAIQNMIGTSGRQRVESAAFDRLIVRLPPLPIQRRIAEILGRLDDKIELNRRINRTLEAMAQALYKHWFVDFGPFQDGEFVESEMGLVPRGWEVGRVGDVAQINARSIRNGNEPSQIRYVDIASVSTGRIDETTAMPFSEAPSRAQRLVSHGDIIWSAVRPNRRAFALIQFPDPDLVVSTGFAVLSPNRIPYSYLYACLSTQDFADYLEARATGAAYPAVRGDDFEEAPIIIPPDTILDRFHSVAQPWFEQQHVLRNEERQLAAAHDYLLPKLLSGEVPPGVAGEKAMV